MEKWFVVLAVVFSSCISASMAGTTEGFFIENRGQVVDYDKKTRIDVLCYGNLNGCIAYVTDRGVSFVSVEKDGLQAVKNYPFNSLKTDVSAPADIMCTVTHIDLPLPALASSRHRFLDREDFYFNYYLPQCKDGITNVTAFKTVDYPGLQEGTGVQLSIRQGKMVIGIYGENNSSRVSLFNDINARVIARNLENTCIVEYSGEEQTNLGKQKRDNLQGFNDDIMWSSYFGGSSRDYSIAAGVDADDNIIIGGQTASFDFPVTAGCFQDSMFRIDPRKEMDTITINWDIVFAKFDSSHKLLWCTYIGGNKAELLSELEIDGNNSIWFCGSTKVQILFGTSTTIHKDTNRLPVTDDAFQKVPGGHFFDGIIGNISAQGYRNYLTFYGGQANEDFHDVMCDDNDNVYVCGETNSPDFPVTPQTTNYQLYTQIALVKFNKNYQREYATLIGGNGKEFCRGIAVDIQGNIIIAGSTESIDLPVRKALQPKKNEYSDEFIIKLDPQFNIIWSTYYGGSAYDYATNVLVDKDNNIYVDGYTSSSDLKITTGAYQTKPVAGQSRFLLKLDPDCNVLWNSFCNDFHNVSDSASLAGYLSTKTIASAIDRNGNIALGHSTKLSGLMVSDTAIQKTNKGSNDVFLLFLNKEGQYLYSSYFGGSADDLCFDLAFNSLNSLLLAGSTCSQNLYVTNNAFQDTLHGVNDGFFVEFGPSDIPEKDSCDETGFEYTDFTDDANIGYAGKARRDNKNIRLTESDVNRVGAAWYKYRMPVRNGFTTEFSFRMSEGVNGVQSDSSCPGADGLTFVIQNKDMKAVGLPGGRIGYDPVPNSLAVEYDLFDNDENQIESLNDPNGNHIAVMSKGKEPNSSNHGSGGELGFSANIVNFESNSTVYYSKIDYSSQDEELRVYINKNINTFSNPAIIVRHLDLAKLLDLSEGEWAYAGFTSATGSSYQNHDILSWKFCPKPTDSQQTDVEEENSGNSGDLLLYPNPVEDCLSVNAGETGDRLVIYDLMGREVKSVTVEGSAGIDVSALPRGCYIVTVFYDDGESASALIIIK